MHTIVRYSVEHFREIARIDLYFKDLYDDARHDFKHKAADVETNPAYQERVAAIRSLHLAELRKMCDRLVDSPAE